MIHITVLDASLVIAPPGQIDVTVDDTDQYLAGYDRIACAIHAGQDLRVLVTDRTAGRWMKVLARRYGAEHVTVEEMTLRRRLQQQIGINIPEYVTDQDIKESQLLDLHIPATPNIPFEDYVLEVFFGNFLTLPGGLRRVGDLVASYEPEQWIAALKRPLVRDIFQARIREKRQRLRADKQTAELQLLDWVETSPDVLIRNLFALKILCHYPPELGTRVFGDVYGDLLRLNLDLGKIPSTIASNQAAIDEIQVYLKQLTSPADKVTIETLLSQVSGCLELEFNAVMQALATGIVEVTHDLVQRVRNKFKAIEASPGLAQALADLDLLVSRERPPQPNTEWDENGWIDWATERYLPYRFWLENTGRLDDDIGELAGTYSDWLYDNLGKIRYHSPRMGWKALLDLKDQMQAHPGPVLVVVIDNLNAKFYPDLRTQLQDSGYYQHSLSYCLSMPPSCTEVSKKCLMTGHYVPFNGSAYKRPVESVWSKRLGRPVLYVSSIGGLRDILERQHDIFFLNYLPLDISMHQNERDTGVSHARLIRSYLTSLARDIRAFATRVGAERDLMVIVVSDHGSTRIPKGTINVIQGKFYRDRAQDEHHRYLSVTDEELHKLPTNARFDCYIFERQTFELGANYLVARRLYRFLPTNENTYIHGGLTPEETLVPLAVFLPITVSPKPLTLNLVGASRIYLGTKFDLELEVTNLNDYACEQVKIEIIDPNLDAEPAHLEQLMPLMRQSVKMPARCHRAADATAKGLRARVSYRFLGQIWSHEITIPAEIIDPAKPGFDLDNL